jgi:hypothetical protein
MKRAWIAAIVSLWLLVAPSAQAVNDPVGGGSTKLTLDKSFSSFLRKNSLKLRVKAGAKRMGSAIVLPVSGGSLDPTSGKGQVEQEGSIVFEAGGRRVPLRGIAVKTKRTPLIAKVGGGQLKIATATRIASRRDGFGSAFQATKLGLTAKLATRLNKKLRPTESFEEGQVLGSLTTKSQPALITVLEANRATFALDPAFLAKLNDRFVSVNPIFPAERQGTALSFPIVVGGAIAPDGSEGTLRTGGAMELLQLGAGQVFWHELWLDLGARTDSAEVDVEPTPAFPGKLGRIGVFDLSAAPISADPKSRTVSTPGAPLLLQAATAMMLNQAFADGAPVFAAGETVGTLTFTAQGQ